MSDIKREQLLDELLQYVYGCHENPADVERRLADDPALRGLLAEARETAEILGDAAKETAPAIDLGARTAAPGRDRSRTRWRIALGLAALVAVGVGLPFLKVAYHEAELQRLTDRQLRLVVSGPPTAPDASPVSYRVKTSAPDGAARAARVEWSFVDASGATLWSGAQDSDGALDVSIPADIDRSGTMRVTADANGERQVAELTLRGGSSAPLAHLTVDKPAYRPGETVRVRGVFLDRRSLLPRDGRYRVRVVDGKGAEVHSTHVRPQDGVGAFVYEIPDGAAGGRYACELRDDADALAVERIDFLVRSFQPPKLKKTVDLARETYAPGETGAAGVTVERLSGGPAFGARITGRLVVDGVEAWTQETFADDDGKATFRFQVPENVERGEARFVAAIEDRGVRETAIQPFVIPLDKVDVDFYPEGGDLVDGVANRVYADVRDALDRPTSASGAIVAGDGKQVAHFDTDHQGRARFTFTPVAGERYRLEVESPCRAGFDLPQERGEVALHSIADSYEAGAPIACSIDAADDGPWLVAAFCRGDLVASDTLRGRGRHDVTLAPADDVAGVLRLTVFDRELQPRAERLIHRASGHDLRVAIQVDDEVVAPGQHQQVAVKTTNADGDPVAALVGLTVTDRAVRDMTGEHRVGLADQTWLMGDVDDLEEAHDFLVGVNSARNIDLLLGTSGWRRFAWTHPDALIAEHGDAGRRLLAREVSVATPTVVDTDDSGKAAVQAAQSRVTRSERSAKRFAGLTTALSVLIAIVGVGAWAGRRALPRVRFSGVLGGLASGAAAVLCVVVFVQYAENRRPVVMLRAAFVEGDRFLEDGAGNWDGIPVGDAAEPEAVERLRELGYADARFALGAEAAVDRDAGRFVELKRLAKDDRKEEWKAIGYLGGDDEDHDEEELRRGDDLRDFAARQRRKRIAVVEYAHRAVNAPERRDFTETVLWKPYVVTGADGVASVEFDVSDSVTTWSVFADAHGGGHVGQGVAEFQSRIPLHLEPTLPAELTLGDTISLPIAVICDDPAIERVGLEARTRGGLSITGDASADLAIQSGGARWLVPMRADRVGDLGRVELAADGRRFGDRVERAIRVVPRGFPQRVSHGGRVTATADFTVRMPDSWLDGSLSAVLKVYPSPLSSLKDGMDGMLREPCGCFEQASSSNYPNLLALSLSQAAGGDDPAFQARARELLVKGYAKIAGYECSERGYEWFGSNPGHEALTAYGLLEFHDMARVYDDVDMGMVDRTRQWLLKRRDGRGGYLRDSKALDSFGRAPAEVTDAYISYALAATDPSTDLSTELDRLAVRARESDDPYEVALAAAGLFAGGRDDDADRARDRLKGWQREDGGLVGSSTSITSSRGVNLEVETTGFAMLAWLDDPDDAAFVEHAASFLQSKRDGRGTFGATQATIVALRALTAYAESRRRIATPGTLAVTVDGTEVDRFDFEAGRAGVITFDRLAPHLQAGDNHVTLSVTGENEFPFAFDAEYFAELPADHPDGAVAIETTLAEDEVREGALVPLTIRVTNRTSEGVPMTTAIVGMPASLEVDTRVLDDLKKGGRFDLWELREREVILYWRGLAPHETKEVHLDLLARIPGRTTGPASRAYLYYTDDQKRYAEPLVVTVANER